MAEALNDQDPEQQQDEPQPDPLEEVRRERDALQDRLLRTAAEFDNYRKRMDKERRDLAEYTAGEAVKDLLPIIDNLERALASAGEGEESLAEGVKLVHSELVAALERSGVKPIEADGEPFDPNVHEALSTRSENGAEAGQVLDVVQKGYRLEGTVLRPARVVVAA